MKAIAVSLGVALAVAGCSMESAEDQMENGVRNSLASQGNVTDVQLTRDGDNVTGYADLDHRQAGPVRLNCAGRVEGERYNVNCLPAVTERVIQDTENSIRERLGQQEEVLEVELTRQDDARMTGYVRSRTSDGTEIRRNCVATREVPSAVHFNWECNPAE